MKQFIVFNQLTTPVTLSSVRDQQKGAARWKFDLTGENKQLIIQERMAPFFGIQRSIGLDIYARLQAADEAAAKATAEDLFATIYTLLCFAGRTYIERNRHISTVEIVDGEDDLFSYTSYDEPAILRTTSRVQVKEDVFEELWQADIKLNGGQLRTSRKQRRLAMAMLSNGIAQGPEISRFFHYWIGIAALDHELKPLEGVNGEAGWTPIFAKHGLDYRAFAEARNKMQHPLSWSKFAKAFEFAKANMDKLEPVLAETVLRLYGVSEKTKDSIMDQNALGPNEAWTVLHGKAEGIPSNFDDVPAQFAHFTGKSSAVNARVDDDNTVTMDVKNNFTADFGPGVRATATSVSRYMTDIAHIKKIGETKIEHVPGSDQ